MGDAILIEVNKKFPDLMHVSHYLIDDQRMGSFKISLLMHETGKSCSKQRCCTDILACIHVCTYVGFS